MPTNLALDDRLIVQAVRAGRHKTKTQAVNAAMEEYVKQQRRLRILDLEGTIEFWPDWDHKADRMRGLKRIPKD